MRRKIEERDKPVVVARYIPGDPIPEGFVLGTVDMAMLDGSVFQVELVIPAALMKDSTRLPNMSLGSRLLESAETFAEPLSTITESVVGR